MSGVRAGSDVTTAASTPAAAGFWVGDTLVEPSTGRVVCGEECSTLEGQHLRVLMLLVERSGEILEYAEIERIVWPNSPAARESLYRAISHLRRALGDNSRAAQHIKTVARRGYQFVAPIRPLPGAVAQRSEPAAQLELAPRRARPAPGLAVACSVFVLAAVLVVLGLSDRRQALTTTREQAQAEQVSNLMVSSFPPLEPGLRNSQGSTASQVLAQTEQRLPIDLAQQPLLQARFLEVIGQTYRRQAAHDKALPALLRAKLLYAENGATSAADMLQLHVELTRVTQDLELYVDTASYFDAAVSGMRATSALHSRSYALLLMDSALRDTWSARPETGLQKANEALRLMSEVTGDRSSGTASVLDSMSQIYLWVDEFESAENAARKSLSIYEAMLPRLHPDRMAAEDALARPLRYSGRLAEAEVLLQRVLAGRMQLFGPRGLLVADSLLQLAELRMMQQRWSESEALVRQALAAYSAVISRPTLQTGVLQTALGVALLNQDRPDEAAARLADAISIFNSAQTSNDQYLASAEHFLGETLLAQNRLPAAEASLVSARTHWEQSEAPRWRVARTQSALGEVLVRRGQTAAGKQLLIESHRLLTQDVKADASAKMQASARLQRLLGREGA